MWPPAAAATGAGESCGMRHTKPRPRERASEGVQGKPSKTQAQGGARQCATPNRSPAGATWPWALRGPLPQKGAAQGISIEIHSAKGKYETRASLMWPCL